MKATKPADPKRMAEELTRLRRIAPELAAAIVALLVEAARDA